MKIKFYEEFEEIVKRYNIDKNDICIIGSCVLANADLRQNNDFDFAITPKAREKLLDRYGQELKVLPTGTICFTDEVQILQNRYAKVGISDEKLFENYVEKYKEYKIAKIEVEIAQKIKRYVKKDEIDLKELGYSKLLEELDWNEIKCIVCHESIERKSAPIRKKSFMTRLKKKIKEIIFPTKVDEKKINVGMIESMFSSDLLCRCYKNGRRDILLFVLYLTGKLDEDEKKELEDKYNLNFTKLEKVVKEYETNLSHLMIDVNEHGEIIEDGYRAAFLLTQNNKVMINRCSNVENKMFKYKIERKSIEEKIEELLIDEGNYTCGIIWGAAYDQFDLIETDIALKYRIVRSFNLMIDDLDSFIFDIYSIDNVDLWKIKLKQGALKGKNCVRVVLFEIDEPNYRKNERTGYWLSDSGVNLKRFIREKYKRFISDYVPDIIFHTGDNCEVNKELVRIIKGYWK